MLGLTLLSPIILLLSTVRSQDTETHTVTFDTSRCSGGTVKLLNLNGSTPLPIENGQYTGSGPLDSATAYLDNGKCTNDLGWGCTLLEMTLLNNASNPTPNSVDISLVEPHAFTDGIAWKYTNGDRPGYGSSCGDAECVTAFHSSTDFCALINVGGTNVDIAVTFCVQDSAFTADSSYQTCTGGSSGSATTTSATGGSTTTAGPTATITNTNSY